MPENNNEFKNEFKRWCVENGHTARSIAEKIGISIHTVHSYMEGRRYPSRFVQKRIEEEYQVDVRTMFPF